MEHYNVTQTSPTSLHVEGLPDATKIVQLGDAKARRVGDLALHRSDLAFALECLDAIPQHNDVPIIQAALWRSAIVSYFKSFGDPGKRFQLDATQVYKGQPPEALQVFEFMKSLRNKHIVHDENTYKLFMVGAAINDGSKEHRVEKMLAMVHTYEVLSSESLHSFRFLVKYALKWITRQFDQCAELITAELERLPYNDLATRPSVTFQTPTVADVNKSRE